MEVQLINKDLLSDLHEKAAANERLRMNFDLRTTADDTSQRMLNALQPGTKVPIHRHLKTSETVVCLEGCLDWYSMRSCPIWMLAALFTMARWLTMRLVLKRQLVSGYVLGMVNSVSKCRKGHGIRSLYTNQARYSKLRTEGTGNEVRD